MKTFSMNDGVLGVYLAFYAGHPTLTQIDPGQATSDAMDKKFLICRAVHSLHLDHLIAWYHWAAEKAKGDQADQAKVLSLYARRQRLEGLMRYPSKESRRKPFEPIDWDKVKADVYLFRSPRRLGNGEWGVDPLSPVTPFIQNNPSGRALLAALERDARAGRHADDGGFKPLSHRRNGRGRRRTGRHGRELVATAGTEDHNPVLTPEVAARIEACDDVQPIVAIGASTPTLEEALEQAKNRVPTLEEALERARQPEIQSESVVEDEAEPSGEPLPLETIIEVNAASEVEAELAARDVSEGGPSQEANADTEHVVASTATEIPYGLSELEPEAPAVAEAPKAESPRKLSRKERRRLERQRLTEEADAHMDVVVGPVVSTTIEPIAPIAAEPAGPAPVETAAVAPTLTAVEIQSAKKSAAKCCTDLKEVFTEMLGGLPKQVLTCSCGGKVEVGQ